jgi:hypothetical protein
LTAEQCPISNKREAVPGVTTHSQEDLKAGAEMENNCCRASFGREHVGLLPLDQWVKVIDVYGRGVSN